MTGECPLIGPKEFLPYLEWKTGFTLRKGRFADRFDEWIASGGDVPSIFEGGDFDQSVDTVQDAQAICRALESERALEPDELDTPAHSNIVGFLRRPGNGIVAAVFAADAVPSVRHLFQKEFAEIAAQGDACDEYDSRRNAAMSLLSILALYGLPEDTPLIISTAAHPAFEDEYQWSPLLGGIGEGHPEAVEICNALRDGIPGGFAGVAYLDFANGLALTGRIPDHPFNTDQGVERLTAHLTDTDPEHDSHAKSAVTALPFIDEPARSRLVDIASGHEAVTVKLEAAWAMAKLGSEQGRDRLVAFCRDPKTSGFARAYLEEMGLSSHIPQECREPDFLALAEMCEWLTHPMEFGRAPDHIEQYDVRKLYWPPTGDKRWLWLFKYRYDPEQKGEEADEGVGMVGSVTFALFGEATVDLPPEDIYALHCCWELEEGGDPDASSKRTAENGRKILAKRNPGFA